LLISDVVTVVYIILDLKSIVFREFPQNIQQF
jgi:hypothetical protein